MSASHTVRFQDLVTLSGVQDLFPNASAEEAHEVRDRAKRILSRAPELKDVQVGTGESHYSPELDVISLAAPSGDELAHEAGHARSVGRASPTYKSLLALSNKANLINSIAALPVSMTLGSMVQDKDTRNAVLAPLAGVSAALALPSLYEETKATVNAVGSADQKLRSAGRLLPSLLQHYIHGLAAPTVYLGQILSTKGTDT